LVIAIEIGIVLSSFMFMKRMSESVLVENITTETVNGEHQFDEELLDLPKDVLLYEINGPLFFGAARQFQETITNTHFQPKVIIIRMRYVPLIDATGYQSLKEIIKSYQKREVKVILSGICDTLKSDFEKNGMYAVLDSQFIVADIKDAIGIAGEH
jgi:SulP family sulfate permease